MSDYDIRFDRSVDPAFLRHFGKDGVAGWLAKIARPGSVAHPLDLQMRKNPASDAQHASLYVGLTSVLNVHRVRAGGLRLDAHRKWSRSRRFGFDQQWRKAAPEAVWRQRWPDVELYLERVIPVATRSHGMNEGAVQAAVSATRHDDWVLLDREVIPSFRNVPTKQAILDECRRPVLEALRRLDRSGFDAGPMPTRFGAECDLLAVDTEGRVLAIEVKPWSVGSIIWASAQAAMYARVLGAWVDRDPKAASTLSTMMQQRRDLDLSDKSVVVLPKRLEVVPVVVLQRGAAPLSIDRMLAVRDALATHRALELPPVEIFEVSITGDVTPLR